MVRCITNDIYVPADAEFVLEGYVDPREDFVTGRDPSGIIPVFILLADKYPRFSCDLYYA